MIFNHVSFTGHETFPFRYAWLKKAVDHIEGQPKLFGREDAMVLLGVGKNMVHSIRHWGLVCGMLEEDLTVPNSRGRSLRATEFGVRLLGVGGWDPYIEDPATPWLLHWRIASVPDNATTWYWVFNHLSALEFSKSDLENQLWDLAQQRTGSRVTRASLKRDTDTFIRTYVSSKPDRTTPLEDTLDCPLVELGLLREAAHRKTYLRVRSDHPSLPDALFQHGLCEFIKRRSASTVAFDDVAYAPGSPGRVFSLSEDGLLERLERLDRSTRGQLVFDDTAGLRQVLVRKLPNAEAILATYYAASRNPQGGRR